jgi:hypothetical protein
MFLSWWMQTASGKRGFERWKLRAPVFGKIITMVAICRFCRILGTMLHNIAAQLIRDRSCDEARSLLPELDALGKIGARDAIRRQCP